MDLKTLSAILSQQIQDSVNIGASIQQLAFTVSQLANQENSTAEVNPQVKALYEEYLGEPNSHKAHELLHTHYHAREKFSD